MEKLVDGILGYLVVRLVIHRRVVFGVLAGFVLSMFVFADEYQIILSGKAIYAVAYGFAGIGLFCVGCDQARDAYLGVDPASTERGENPSSIGNRLAGIFLALLFLCGGVGMVIGTIVYFVS